MTIETGMGRRGLRHTIVIFLVTGLDSDARVSATVADYAFIYMFLFSSNGFEIGGNHSHVPCKCLSVQEALSFLML